MWHTTVGWIVRLYLAWLALVVLVILPLLNFLPHYLVREQLDREFRSELILFNPFTLTLTLHEGELLDADSSPMLRVGRLSANLGLASLWRRTLWLDAVDIRAPELYLVRDPEGELNILSMLPETEPPPEVQDDEPFPLHLAQLSLRNGRVDIEDQTLAEPWQSGIHSLSVLALGLSTDPEVDGSYQLSLKAREGGRLSSSGELAVGAASASGELGIEDLQLAPAVRRADSLLPFATSAGTLNLGTRFQLEGGDNFRATLDQGKLGLTDLAALPRDIDAFPDTHLSLEALQLDGLALDTREQSVRAETLQLTGLDVAGWQDAEQISLLALLPETSGAAEQAPATDAPGDPDSDWELALSAATLTDSRAHWRSPFTEPAITVNRIEARVDDLRWPAQAPWPLQLALELNQQARLEANGQFHPGTGDGSLEASLEALPLAWFAPNLPTQLRAEIDSGSLNTTATAKLADFQPETISLDGAIREFAILLRGAEDELTSWEQLAWNEVRIELPKQQVEVASVHLDGFSGRLHIDSEGRVNWQRVFAAVDDTADQDQPQASQGEPADKPNDNGPDTADESTDAVVEAWAASIPEIQITDSALDFMDESLPIHFRTIIGDLDGSVTGFQLDPDARVEIDLGGAVDGYAPVTLAGHAFPLRSPPDLSLALNFRGIDMARLSPYSGTYAGYKIERGTLTLDLDYQLDNQRLQGSNQVVISQLQLGEQVDSDRALDLPLRLGIALLTDSQGVIDLDVPVSGDLENPQFSLGSVIAGAFVNLLRSAVTAPFSLLASLVGSEADLRRVDFAAGSTTLDQHSTEKLEDLAKALEQRPAIELLVTGQSNPKTDGRQLREERLRRALLEEGLAEDDLDNRSEAWEQAIAERYAALASASDEEAAEPPSPVAQFREVRDALELPASALGDLASERAATIKRFLVNQSGIAPQRITIDAPAESPAGSSAAIMEVDA